ncbi:restriction endonuclease [Thermomonas sp.]|uniref:restriction endonuclease n=1 Tax=Thermomonas sp. TaxID=1971895 RepID=UPI002487FB60|nr:restriction endonuclease [Thermomonas sp.]MDI1253196.1 restriction endonuclease [Thermomonas sp.]
MNGLKNVRNRRTDALTQVGWAQLEVMLAVYYRGQGYRVEHVGTGGTGARFDGGIDLKLYKDDAYIVMQCKHWNAKQVPHNAVHELLGVMITQGATGAILVTSGEFSRAAIESATKQGHVQLVDGDALRGMLGPLPAQATAPTFVGVTQSPAMSGAMPQRRESRGAFGHAMDAGLGIVLLKLVVGLIIFLVMTSQIKSIVHALQPAQRGKSGLTVAQRSVLPASGSVPDAGVSPSMPSRRGTGPVVIDHFTGTTIEDRPAGMPAYRPPTAAEQREAKRQADEAMRILERSTPEM